MARLMEPAWRCDAVTVRYPGAPSPALDAVTLALDAGACTVILGPNGSGKSTLLRALLGLRTPDAGTITCFGRPLAAWSRPALARAVGVVPQGDHEAFPLSVRALVAMGRYPHLGPWRREQAADRAAIEAAMARADVTHFAERMLDTLSGGERQRTRIARALAQEPRALVLDEPTASLDLRHEMEILALLRSLSSSGVTVVLVTHNLSVAAQYADRVILLDRGHLVAAGPPPSVLTADTLHHVFGWPVELVHAASGTPHIVPRSP
jgi:ABC-type cobalamin/Fe3+-siderophores transport system ATPase subunit